MTYDEFAEIALSLPDVTEKVGKVENDLFRGGRHIARLRDRRRAIAFRLPWEMREDLVSSQPSVFYVTPHYSCHPYVLALLENLEPESAKPILQAAWSSAFEDIPVRKAPRL